VLASARYVQAAFGASTWLITRNFMSSEGVIRERYKKCSA
jgi:hypothetical protein